MNPTFRDFDLRPVWKNITPSEAREVADMWVEERVLNHAEAERRTNEVVFLVVQRETNKLAGVCTVYQDDLANRGRYWFYRTFIRRASRGAKGIGKFVLMSTFEYLQQQPGDCRGMAIVAENPRFRSPRWKGYMSKFKYPFLFLHSDSRGCDVFVSDFSKHV